jgi:hypothetical protein
LTASMIKYLDEESTVWGGFLNAITENLHTIKNTETDEYIEEVIESLDQLGHIGFDQRFNQNSSVSLWTPYNTKWRV